LAAAIREGAGNYVGANFSEKQPITKGQTMVSIKGLDKAKVLAAAMGLRARDRERDTQ
jgi:hypothetical protein